MLILEPFRSLPKTLGVGDYLRAITTPQKKMGGEDGEDGAFAADL